MVECNVQSKIKCVFDAKILSEISSKRSGQNYQVVASEHLSDDALKSDIFNADVSEKVDGTCCHVAPHEGQLCLWARLDRKLNKQANKRFREFSRREADRREDERQDPVSVFAYNYPDDLKTVPTSWVPANGVARDPETGNPQSDANGHIPGWVPIHVDSKQYCWHHSVVADHHLLVLTMHEVDGSFTLRLSVEPMANYCGRTLELIGTNVNANPYGLGSKQHPFHVLVPHGGIPARGLPARLTFSTIKEWFRNVDDDKNVYGNLEGIVWHCKDGRIFKLHRHHLGLPWPLRQSRTKDDDDGGTSNLPLLCGYKVLVESRALLDMDEAKLTDLFLFVKKSHLKYFPSLHDLALNLSFINLSVK